MVRLEEIKNDLLPEREEWENIEGLAERIEGMDR